MSTFNVHKIFLQVLLKTSAYLAISTYGVMSLIAAVAAICLPIETKGRDMKVHTSNMKTVSYEKLLFKVADRLCVIEQLISTFVFTPEIVQFLFYLNPKFQASGFLLCMYKQVCVRPGEELLRLFFSCCGSFDALTHISLGSLLWDIGKQYSPRCDAADRGVPSGAILFALRNFIEKWIKNSKSFLMPFKMKVDSPK